MTPEAKRTKPADVFLRRTNPLNRFGISGYIERCHRKQRPKRCRNTLL